MKTPVVIPVEVGLEPDDSAPALKPGVHQTPTVVPANPRKWLLTLGSATPSLELSPRWNATVSPGQIAVVRAVVAELDALRKGGNLDLGMKMLDLDPGRLNEQLSNTQINCYQLYRSVSDKLSSSTSMEGNSAKEGGSSAAPPGKATDGHESKPTGETASSPSGGDNAALARAKTDLTGLAYAITDYWRAVGGEGSLPLTPHGGRAWVDLYLGAARQEISGNPSYSPSSMVTGTQNFYSIEIIRALNKYPYSKSWPEAYINLNYEQHTAEFIPDGSKTPGDIYLGKQSFEGELGLRYTFLLNKTYPALLAGMGWSPFISLDYTNFTPASGNPTGLAGMGATRRKAGLRVEELWNPWWRGSFLEVARFQDPLIPSQPNRMLYRLRGLYGLGPKQTDMLKSIMVEFQLNKGMYNIAMRQDPMELKVGFSLGLTASVNKLLEVMKKQEWNLE
jgi:hypothetical protein